MSFAKGIFGLSALVILCLIPSIALGQANTWPDYRGDMIGVPMGSSGAVPSGVLYCEPPTDDSAPMTCYLQGADAWEQATVNTTGGDLVISPGIGTHKVVIDDFNNCAAAKVTVTIDGVSTQLTESIEWTAATDNATTALSLANAIDAITGIKLAYTDAIDTTFIKFEPTVGYVDLAETVAACTTLVENSTGDTYLTSKIVYIGDENGNITWNSGSNLMNTCIGAGCYLYVGSGSVRTNSSSYIGWLNKSEIYSPVDGQILMTNDAGTDFGLLQLGGSTSAYPALKRSGGSLHVRLADDSNYSNLTANNIYANSTNALGWAARSIMKSPANGEVKISDSGESQGVTLKTTDAADTLSVYNLAGGAYGNFRAAGGTFSATTQVNSILSASYFYGIGVNQYRSGSQSTSATVDTGDAILATGAHTNVGNYNSGDMVITTGTTDTDGNTGNITIYTGLAGAGQADSGSIKLGVHGDTTGASLTIDGPTGAVLPYRYIAADVSTEPYVCDSTTVGSQVYADDADDTAYGRFCSCVNLDGTGYQWRDSGDIVGTSCFFGW